MNKNLKTISDAVNEIREIVGGECIHISDLPEVVRNSIGTGGSGHTTAFVFSSNSLSNTPTANKINVETGLVENLDKEWSQTNVKLSQSGDQTVLMSFALFDSSGDRTTS